MMRVVDLFSGAGGFAKGFVMEGFKIVLAVEKDVSAANTYISNISPENMIVGDIRRLHSHLITYLVGDDIDVVIASPPCEAFTMASRTIMKDPLDRLYSDPRGRLTLEAIRIIGDLNPRIFVIENVPGILFPPIPDYIRKEFSRAGFDKIFFNRLNAIDYGNPSHRRRVFISNVKIRPLKNEEARKVMEVIGDLPDPRLTNDIPNHTYVKTPKRFEKRIHRIRWGDALEYFRGGFYNEYKQYIRLHPYKHAPTIMGKSRFVHPYQPRILTVREQARLMGYPDDYIFKGPIDSQYNQVGESVPPPLSRAIARFLITILDSTSS